MMLTTKLRIQARDGRQTRVPSPRLAAFAGLLLFACSAHAQQPAEIAGSFAQLGHGRLASRSISLAELGMRDPLVLRAPDARQELYLPVPAGVPLTDASLQIDGGYLHGNGGRVTMLVSLDGSPVLSRSPTQEQGDGSATLGVDGAARPSGFVRVGLDWSSVINDNVCTDQTAIGNVWRVAPTSRLTYRYDPGAIVDLRGAWSALPHKPVVMLGARSVAAPAFDAGWRVEALLQREGRAPLTRAWPAAGDTVDLTGIDVPAPLRAIPAFAALAAGGSHKLANAAEAGALIAVERSQSCESNAIANGSAPARTGVSGPMSKRRRAAGVTLRTCAKMTGAVDSRSPRNRSAIAFTTSAREFDSPRRRSRSSDSTRSDGARARREIADSGSARTGRVQPLHSFVPVHPGAGTFPVHPRRAGTTPPINSPRSPATAS